MATIQAAKARIKTKLDTLVSASLGTVIIQDLKVDPLSMEVASYPVAVIHPPSLVESVALDNRSNVRSYQFAVTVMMKPENFATVYDVENLQETIINLFDDDPTFSGDGDAGVEPSYSQPYPLNYAGKDLVMFQVFLTIKIRRDLGFA